MNILLIISFYFHPSLLLVCKLGLGNKKIVKYPMETKKIASNEGGWNRGGG